jgi:flagellar biosynthesis protein FlhF
MQVKRFEGTDMQEVLRLVKHELGPHAIILSTRQVRKGRGSFGMFGRSMIEVTAAVDREAETLVPAPLSPRRVATSARQPEAPSHLDPSARELAGIVRALDPLQRDMDHVKELLQHLVSRERLVPQSHPFGLEREFIAVRQMVEHLLQGQADSRSPLFVPSLMPLYQRLLASGMEETLARRLLERAQNSMVKERLAQEDYVQSAVADTLMKVTPICGPLSGYAGQQVVAAFVGPTGVGKTTTIAKLAAQYALGEKKKVALLTIDTYRIAAVEQLRIFAKLIGIPLEVVMSASELDRSLALHREKDLLLIDTAGRSQRDTAQMAELASCFAHSRRATVHLVLSATASQQNLADIVERFRPLALESLIFTKLDESNTFGGILNTALQVHLPLSYLTTGQRVPEDIEVATPERVVDLILNVSHWHGTATV